MFSKVKAFTKSLLNGNSFEVQNPPINEQNNLSFNSVNETIIIDEQRTETNEEDVAIVWFGKNAKNINTQLFIGSLRSINDYIQIFNDEDDVLTYIESVFEEKILLILEDFSDHLLNLLQALKQVEAVFIYTSVLPIQMSLFNAIICPTQEQLINKLKLIRQQLNKQMVVFSVYNQTNKEKHDLIHEVGSFLFFQLFKVAFKSLPKNSESKKLMISKYRNYYIGNGKILKEINNFEMNYKSSEALRWYTNNSFIYRLINKALRTENFNTLCYFHFYIGDLSKQIEKEFNKYKKQNSNSILRVYRNFKITKEEIENFKQNIGKLILTNGYLSTKRHRNNAHNFIKKQNVQINEENVLFEYTVDLNLVKSIIFADISQYNSSPNDDEILFDLGTAFKIDSCTFNEKDNLWLINVSATDEGVDAASEYIEYQKDKMAESNIMLMLGHLIIETGNYEKAEKYFDALLDSSFPNDEEIACIFYNLGRICRLKGEYERGLEILNRSYYIHSNARPTRLVSAAKSMNAIGILYMKLNNVPKAIEAFEHTLKLYARTIAEYHPDVGGTLVNLGNIYSEQGQFDNALSCFERAQNIYEYNLPLNHPNKAILLNNIGNLYYQQGKFKLALDAFQLALNINEKILPPNHPDLVRNRHNLSKVYISLGDQTETQYQSKQDSEHDSIDVNALNESNKSNLFPSESINTNKTSESIEMNNY